MTNRKIEQKSTKQVIVDAGLHKILKLKATEAGMTIKDFLEGYLAELLAVEEKKI